MKTTLIAAEYVQRTPGSKSLRNFYKVEFKEMRPDSYIQYTLTLIAGWSDVKDGTPNGGYLPADSFPDDDKVLYISQGTYESLEQALEIHKMTLVSESVLKNTMSAHRVKLSIDL